MKNIALASARSSAVAGRLQLEHLRVSSANVEKLFVAPLLGNNPIFEDQDSICHFDSREAMRNQERRFTRCQFAKPFEDFMLGASIQRSRGLVQNEELRITQIGARESDFLPFSPGKIDSPFEPATQTLLIAVRKLANHIIRQTLAGSR